MSSIGGDGQTVRQISADAFSDHENDAENRGYNELSPGSLIYVWYVIVVAMLTFWNKSKPNQFSVLIYGSGIKRKQDVERRGGGEEEKGKHQNTFSYWSWIIGENCSTHELNKSYF